MPNKAKHDEDARNAATDAHDNDAKDGEDAKRPMRPEAMRMLEPHRAKTKRFKRMLGDMGATPLSNCQATRAWTLEVPIGLH